MTREAYGDNWRELSAKCKKRDGYRCVRCKFKPDKENRHLLHADHVIPLSKGGKNALSNLQTLCCKCHQAKTNRNRPKHLKVDWVSKAKINKPKRTKFRPPRW